jgi:transcriptional regulator with XRE-family HTH domain
MVKPVGVKLKHDEVAKVFGGNMRKFRMNLGLTQEQLAKAIDAPYGSISAWEHGQNLPLSERIRSLAVALNVQMKDLFTDDDSEISLDEALGVIRNKWGIEIRKLNSTSGRYHRGNSGSRSRTKRGPSNRR